MCITHKSLVIIHYDIVIFSCFHLMIQMSPKNSQKHELSCCATNTFISFENAYNTSITKM